MGPFFGIPRGWKCYEIKYEQGKLRILAQSGDFKTPMELIGTADVEAGEQAFHFEQAVTAYLTEAAQEVFPGWTKRELVWGPKIKYVRRKGLYKSADGAIERPIVVTMPLNEFHRSISGVVDGKPVLNIELQKSYDWKNTAFNDEPWPGSAWRIPAPSRGVGGSS